MVELAIWLLALFFFGYVIIVIAVWLIIGILTLMEGLSNVIRSLK